MSDFHMNSNAGMNQKLINKSQQRKQERKTDSMHLVSTSFSWPLLPSEEEKCLQSLVVKRNVSKLPLEDLQFRTSETFTEVFCENSEEIKGFQANRKSSREKCKGDLRDCECNFEECRNFESDLLEHGNFEMTDGTDSQDLKAIEFKQSTSATSHTELKKKSDNLSNPESDSFVWDLKSTGKQMSLLSQSGLKTRPKVRRRPDPSLQKLHQIINRATAELDTQGIEFSEVFAKTLAEASEVIKACPRPISQEQVATQLYGLPAVIERLDEYEESPKMSSLCSPSIFRDSQEIKPGSTDSREYFYDDSPNAYVDRDCDLEKHDAAYSPNPEEGWPEPFQYSTLFWHHVVFAAIMGCTLLLLLVGIIFEICSMTSIFDGGAIFQPSFFVMHIASLVACMQALWAAKNRQQLAHTNAALILWLMQAGLATEYFMAIFTKGEHFNVWATLGPLLTITLICLAALTVMIIFNLWRTRSK